MAFLLSSCGGGHESAGDANGGAIAAQRNPAACTDFYAYANSAWIAATPIPIGAPAIDLFTGVVEQNRKALLAKLDRFAAGDGVVSSPDQQALLNLDASRADTEAIERAGLAPLADDLALIDGMTDSGQLATTWGLLVRRGVRLPVSLKIEVYDDTEHSDPAVHADWLSVTIDPLAPARATDDVTPNTSTSTPAFQAHIARTLELTGMPAAEAADAGIAAAAIERALTLATHRELDATTPRFDMPALLTAAGVPGALPRVVDDSVLRVLGDLQNSFGAREWRSFMRWRLARSFTDYLPTRFAAERARWDLPALPITTPDNNPVDARIAFLSSVLPREFDLFFAAQVLPADMATQAHDITRDVRAALHQHLDSRSWLGATSRMASHRLLESVELVYPAIDNEIENQANAGLALPTMQPTALLDNVRRAAGYDLDRRFGLALASRTGRSFNGTAWWNSDAGYNFINHSVIVSPVVLQALLANTNSPAARYGSLGVVMAHELLHMFGAPTDIAFTPRQPLGWIAEADRSYFNGMVTRLENDYSTWAKTTYGATVIKPRFMGEDLSDLGSVPVALSALRQAGVTGTGAEDAFYRGFAFGMRTRQSEAEDQSYLTTTSGHAFYKYRINGPLSNLTAFARNYGCMAGDAMVRGPESRVDLW